MARASPSDELAEVLIVGRRTFGSLGWKVLAEGSVVAGEWDAAIVRAAPEVLVEIREVPAQTNVLGRTERAHNVTHPKR